MSAIRRLNWGCGNDPRPGWINSDAKEGSGIDLVCDIRNGLPLETGSLDYAVSIHGLPEIHYDEFAAARPSAVRLQTSHGAGTDLTLRLSQVEVNGLLQPEVFQVEIPADATPVTLDELRRAGPLGTGGAPPARALNQ